MMDEDLDKTKPITTLKDLDENGEELEEEKISRVQKNKDKIDEAIDKEKEEEAEEALAEKNIAMAEALLEEENEVDKALEKVDVKKESLFSKIKNNWNKLDKKMKIIIISIIVLLLALIICGIVLLVVLLKKDEEEPTSSETPTVEEAPVLADNFYYKEGKLYFTEENGSEIGTYECENKSASLCYVGFNKINDTFDVPVLLNQNNETKDQRYPIIDSNYAFIVDNKDENDKTIKLFDIKADKVLDTYMDVKVYDNNYAIVGNDSKYGLIKVEDGITDLIEPQYEYLGMINGENNLIAKYNKGYKVIDKSNKSLSSNFSSSYEIKSYNDNFVVAKVSGDYTVYDYKADLIDSEYDFITVKDNYMFLVKDGKLYVKDKDKVKLNEGNIRLKNSDYVKTYIYDDEDKLSETKMSFDIDVSNKDEIKVFLYESGNTTPEVKTVKIVEALANVKYDYVNYFDGSLYFYEDLEKEQLLGFYTCSNPNEVNAAEDEYNSCFLATDTIYENNDMVKSGDLNRKSRVPIINRRFVFVADGTNNIILYDLEAKKALVDNGYTNVNSYTANNDNKVTLYDGKIDVIALGKKGKYGMLTIDGENVSTKYYFNYNKMEKIGDYVLALDTTNKWKILFSTSNESVGFDSKIRGYNSNLNYYKVKNGDKYIVYDSKGSQVGRETFKYVELYSTYFAAINSNSELNIYDYQGDKISTEGIKIGDYAYYGTETPAFKVSKNGNDYIVSVYNGSTYVDHKANQESSSEPEESVPGTPTPSEDEE